MFHEINNNTKKGKKKKRRLEIAILADLEEGHLREGEGRKIQIPTCC